MKWISKIKRSAVLVYEEEGCSSVKKLLTAAGKLTAHSKKALSNVRNYETKFLEMSAYRPKKA